MEHFNKKKKRHNLPPKTPPKNIRAAAKIYKQHILEGIGRHSCPRRPNKANSPGQNTGALMGIRSERRTPGGGAARGIFL